MTSLAYKTQGGLKIRIKSTFSTIVKRQAVKKKLSSVYEFLNLFSRADSFF